MRDESGRYVGSARTPGVKIGTAPVWCPVRLEALQRFWREGLSATQIAAALGGVTRNGVIGKVHRLGLAGRAVGAKARLQRPVRRVALVATAPAAGKLAPPKSTPAQARASASAARSGPPPVTSQAVAPSALTVLPDTAVLLTHARAGACRWPVAGEFADLIVCGAPAGPGTYCAAHAALATNPRKLRNPAAAETAIVVVADRCGRLRGDRVGQSFVEAGDLTRDARRTARR